MQSDDRAEYEFERVQAVFAEVLADSERAAKLLEHIRYRTGLLVERRPGVFAFAHLTFQEYLAACAVHEGNRLRLGPDDLIKGHNDPRWREVVALFCGLSTDSAALEVIRNLMAEPNTPSIGSVLNEAYRAAKGRIGKNKALRTAVIERIALAPFSYDFGPSGNFSGFPAEEVSPVANRALGMMEPSERLSRAHWWFIEHSDELDIAMQMSKLEHWRELSAKPLSELVFHLHRAASASVLFQLAKEPSLYRAPGPSFSGREQYSCQGEIALMGLERFHSLNLKAMTCVLDTIFRALEASSRPFASGFAGSLISLFTHPVWRQSMPKKLLPIAGELARLASNIVEKLPPGTGDGAEDSLHAWIKYLENPLSRDKPRSKQKRKRR